MSTNAPVTIPEDGSWSEVFSGEFNGGIQNVGNAPLVGLVSDSEAGEPEEGAGGFSIYSQATPIAILGTETLWVRSAGGTGAVVLA